MNVEQGDLAVIVRVMSPSCNPNVGRFVDVLSPTTLYGEPAWHVCMVGRPGVGPRGEARQEGVVRDSSLRPIRPQGPEAVDEMVKLIGAAPMTGVELREWSEQ